MQRSWNVYLVGQDAPTLVTGHTVELGREWVVFLGAEGETILRLRRDELQHIELRESTLQTPRPHQEPSG